MTHAVQTNMQKCAATFHVSLLCSFETKLDIYSKIISCLT